MEVGLLGLRANVHLTLKKLPNCLRGRENKRGGVGREKENRERKED